MFKVGYLRSEYPEKRCIVNKISGFRYVLLDTKKNFPLIINKILYKFKLRKRWDAFSLISINSDSIDVIHTVNTVLRTTNNWCVTFETAVPRTNYTCDKRDYFMSTLPDQLTLSECLELGKDNCLGLLAMSECAFQIQKKFILNSGLPKNLTARILSKTKVLLPPQEILISEDEIKIKYSKQEKLTFIFVGNDFFRKGGKELIDVLFEFKEKYSFKLIVISAMNYENYATLEDKKKYIKIMEKNSWIDYRNSLPNIEVLELIKTSHVGVLPTYAETFGFSVLEMQAAGVPVITTDIRALTEINNNECGWLCHLKQNQNREVSYLTVDEMQSELKEELFSVFKQVFDEWESKKLLETKSFLSLERIKKYHNPKAYAEHLTKIYLKKQTE